MDRYDEFLRLEQERERQRAIGAAIGRLLGQALRAYYSNPLRCQFFDEDPPETWSREWVEAEFVGFLSFLLDHQSPSSPLESFGQEDSTSLPLHPSVSQRTQDT